MRIVAALLTSMVASSALADDMLGLGSVYGDERGCKDQELKNYSEEQILVLRGDGYQTFVSGCEFISVAKTRNGNQVATSVCGNEGDGELSVEFVRIAKVEGADAYEIFGASGNLIGRVDRCIE